MPVVASIDLPSWARVSSGRAAHIARVTALLAQWSDALRVDPAEAAEWRDAGRLHDALRDAPDAELRRLVSDATMHPALLHGPAAAARLAADGETRRGLLDAIAHHTIGLATWERTGRALYMADYLEPGRAFAARERAYLAANAPHDFDGTFREVVRHRLQWAIREGVDLHRQTVDLWNSVR
jgi:2-amino-4-hydroxy-6-hydroxymethyldihydropteridine diphosphokinase